MIWAFGIGTCAYAAYKAETILDWYCACIVVACAVVPAMLWISRWRDTFPIFPVFAIMHVFHYGLPYVSSSSDVSTFNNDAKLTGALTIGGFLIMATLVWAMIMRIEVTANRRVPSFNIPTLKRLLPFGLAIPALFTLSFVSGTIWNLGEWNPVLRAVCWSLLFIAAYIFGALSGKRELGQRLQLVGLTLLTLNILLLWISLYLFTGVLVICVGMVGYVVGGGRVPVAAFAATVASVTILHAGKAEMRERYWSDTSSEALTASTIPKFLFEWVGEGFTALVSPSENASLALADRTGMMHMQLRVQEMTPDLVDYMYGETYAMIPSMLVPRLFVPDKPATRDAAIRMNIHFGVLSEEESESTSIAWGMAPEAYANFGAFGMVGLAVFLGFLTAWLTKWISGAPPFSARLMAGIVVIAQIVNLEGDMATLIVSSMHGLASVVILVLAIRVAAPPGRGRPSPMIPPAR